MFPELVKRFLIKLKKTSVYRILLNNYFIISLYIVLVLLTLNYFLFIILVILFSIYIFRREKRILYVAFSISLLITIIFFCFESISKKESIAEIEGKIINLDKKEEYQKIIIRKGLTKVLVYDYDFIELKIGYIINAKGEAIEISPSRVPNEFNYEEYLKHQKITSVISCKDIKVIKKSFTISSIKTYFIKYLDLYDDSSKMYLKALLLGNDDEFSDTLKGAIEDNGISHLFAISGLHIGLLVVMIKKVLSKVKISEKKITIITIVILSIYLVLTSFSASILRSTLMYFLYIINKRLKLGLTSLDIISIVFITLIVINPYYMYMLGFCLSFIVATTIILISEMYKDKSPYYQILLISIWGQVMTFPIIINMNYGLNLFTPLINVIYISFVSSFLLPFTFLTLLCYPLSYIYNEVVSIFSKITIVISKLINLNFSFPKVDINFVFLYYLFLFFIIKFYFNKKYKYIFFFLIIGLIIIVNNKFYLIKKTEVYFLDVYNGDAVFINDTYCDCTALIDTGDGKNNAVSNFLKSQGVKKLDYLILTHNHNDHNGEANTILNKIKVTNVVTSKYDNSIYSKRKNSLLVSKGESFWCGKIEFIVLHPDKIYQDMNDNSLILYVYIGNYYFLFLGDASKNIENILPDLKVDVLKVAHHGSTTSSSLSFLQRIMPKYSVIMTTRIKNFNFPRTKTIQNLESVNTIIYRTDLNYTIIYKYKKKQSIFSSVK